MTAVRWTKEDLDRHNAKQDAFRAGVKHIVDERAAPKPSKYRSKRCEIDGIPFQSLKEGRRYVELKNMQQAGQIGGLTMQCPIECIVNDVLVCTYIADFAYVARGETIFEDVKGMRTDIYRLKRKLVKACTGIEILET